MQNFISFKANKEKAALLLLEPMVERAVACQRYFEGLDYRVVTFSNVTRALHSLNLDQQFDDKSNDRTEMGLPPDLILIDFGVAEGQVADGLTACRLLKHAASDQSGRLVARLPPLFIFSFNSSVNNMDEMLQAYKAGADYFLALTDETNNQWQPLATRVNAILMRQLKRVLE